MTTVDELGLDPRTLGEEALRRLAEYDKLMGDLQYLTGPEPGLTYHRVTLADGNEVRGHDAQRYAAHLARTIDQLTHLAQAVTRSTVTGGLSGQSDVVDRLRRERDHAVQRADAAVYLANYLSPYLGADDELITVVLDDVVACWQPPRLGGWGGYVSRYITRLVHAAAAGYYTAFDALTAGDTEPGDIYDEVYEKQVWHHYARGLTDRATQRYQRTKAGTPQRSEAAKHLIPHAAHYLDWDEQMLQVVIDDLVASWHPARLGGPDGYWNDYVDRVLAAADAGYTAAAKALGHEQTDDCGAGLATQRPGPCVGGCGSAYLEGVWHHYVKQIRKDQEERKASG
jgi:hypothetical protein